MKLILLVYLIWYLPCSASGSADLLERVVKQIYVPAGASFTQLDELVRQLEVQAIIDHGFKWGYNAGTEEMPWSQHVWLKFVFSKGSIRMALDAFFARNDLYRWRKGGGKLIVIEPSEPHRRLSPLLRKPFKKPIVAVPDHDGQYALSIRNAVQAWTTCNPAWRRQAEEVRFSDSNVRRSYRAWENPLGLDTDAKSQTAFTVRSMRAFFWRWLKANPYGFVRVRYLEHRKGIESADLRARVITFRGEKKAVKRILQGPDAVPNEYEIVLGSWNPVRLRTTLNDLFAGLKSGIDQPIGYKRLGERRRDCVREIVRRYHYGMQEVVKAFQAAQLFRERRSWRRVVEELMKHHGETFGPVLAGEILTASTTVKVELLELGPLYGLPELGYWPNQSRYLPFYQRLSAHSNKEVQMWARRYIGWYRQRKALMEDPRAVSKLETQVRQDPGKAFGPGGALENLQRLGTPAAARAITALIHSQVWKDGADNARIIAYRVKRIPSGRETATKRLLEELKTANKKILSRIHLTLIALTGNGQAKAVDPRDTSAIRSFWKSWKARSGR